MWNSVEISEVKLFLQSLQSLYINLSQFLNVFIKNYISDSEM